MIYSVDGFYDYCQFIFKSAAMKKVPSFSKVTSNTNITVTQTQNISINSPKGMGLNTIVGAKKLFKSNKNIK